jgi:hypothetical protein
VAVWPARRGNWEAGSLGQVRQVPLNPCRESRREHSHCTTRKLYAFASPIGSSIFCWLLFDILRCAMLSATRFFGVETTSEIAGN